VPYKRVPLVVEAFAAMPHRRLVVIGDGPELKRVEALAGENVTILGYQPAEVLREHMQKASAFVFAGEEDFGITLVEAQACGTPVIAYGKGGARDIVSGLDAPRPTGVFFDSQSVEGIISGVTRFERNRGVFIPASCRANALRFSAERFRTDLGSFLATSWKQFVERTGCGTNEVG